MRVAGLSVGVTLLLALGLPSAIRAQAPLQPLQVEWRLEAIFARTSSGEAGLGMSVPVGTYVRSGIVVGAGAGRHGLEGRTDLIARFSLDPFRQSRWAPYGGGGISSRYRSELDGGSKAYLMVFLGLEGPLQLGQTAGWVPAFELGLGGGTRVGFVLRRGVNARR